MTLLLFSGAGMIDHGVIDHGVSTRAVRYRLWPVWLEQLFHAMQSS